MLHMGWTPGILRGKPGGCILAPWLGSPGTPGAAPAWEELWQTKQQALFS